MPLSFAGSGFSIAHRVVGPIDNNAYLIRCEATNEAVLIDAADEPDSLKELVGSSSLESILTTHGHWDHHQAARTVAEEFGVPVLLHPADTSIAGKRFDGDIAPGSIAIGAVRGHVLHTPGHTPGSVCVALPGVVLTGDTLFPGGPGATRFDYSSFPVIIESIRTELFNLADETVVLPGHGAPTTIGTERDHLEEWVRRGW